MKRPLWPRFLGTALVFLAVGFLLGRAGDLRLPSWLHLLDGRQATEAGARRPVAGPGGGGLRQAPRTARPPGPELVRAPRGDGARVAIVIDDLGRSLEELKRLRALGVALTYSVLPFESRTPEIVAALRARGAEILCHLPMEPRNGADPGPGALTRQMSHRQLAAATRAALAQVGGAVGANNHMGSEISRDRRAMKTILQVLKRRELFFLDSRTGADSLGYRTALDLGLAAAERNIFLDNDRASSAVRAQFEELLVMARRRGHAIAIGHPYPVTLEVLSGEVPGAVARGYEFVVLSRLLQRG